MYATPLARSRYFPRNDFVFSKCLVLVKGYSKFFMAWQAWSLFLYLTFIIFVYRMLVSGDASKPLGYV